LWIENLVDDSDVSSESTISPPHTTQLDFGASFSAPKSGFTAFIDPLWRLEGRTGVITGLVMDVEFGDFGLSLLLAM
jgi:hypothetical protein